MKRNKRSYLIAIFGLTTLSVASPFNNCSNVDFGAGVDSQVALDDTTEDDVDDVIRNCENLKLKGQLLQASREVVFEDSKIETGRAQVCLFDQNGNMAMLNNEMRARHEQYVKVNLPAGAVICDVKMQTQLQKFKYDDAFFFTLNDHILASNNRTAVNSRLVSEPALINGATALSLYKYDWSRLITHTFPSNADDFCLGQEQGLAECSWPLTEQNGNIDFEFHPEILIRLGLKASEPKFGFIVSGDNDPNIDCYHERLEFTLDFEYYIK